MIDAKEIPKGSWYAFRVTGRTKMAALTLQESEAKELTVALKLIKQGFHEQGSMSRKALIARILSQLEEQGF